MLIQKILSNHSAPTHKNGCMLWLSGKYLDGYGKVRYNGRTESVHRIVWSYYNEPIPAGMCVCHSCDNPACINPNHLWLGSHADNIRDKMQKGREARGSKQGSTHLADTDVINIRRAYSSGTTAVALAEQYSVTRGAIGDMLAGRSWSHLPGATEMTGRHISKSAVDQIRLLSKRGLGPTEIARKLNRPYSTVYNIATGNRRAGT